MLAILLTAIAVSIDGFLSGFAFGLKKIKIPFTSILFLSMWTTIFSMLSMLTGVYLRMFMSAKIGNYIGAFLLLILAWLTLKEIISKNKQSNPKNPFNVLASPQIADIDDNKRITLSESIIVGIALALDASAAAFALSLNGYDPYLPPIIFGATQLFLSLLGNIAGKNIIITKAKPYIIYMPVFLFVLLAIFRLI